MQRVMDFLCPVCFQIVREPMEPSVPEACYACRSASLRDDVACGECLECGSSTRYGKPYCSDHVDQAPYVAWLLGELGHSY